MSGSGSGSRLTKEMGINRELAAYAFEGYWKTSDIRFLIHCLKNLGFTYVNEDAIELVRNLVLIEDGKVSERCLLVFMRSYKVYIFSNNQNIRVDIVPRGD